MPSQLDFPGALCAMMLLLPTRHIWVLSIGISRQGYKPLLFRQPAPWLPAHSCPPPRSRRLAGPTTGRDLCCHAGHPPSSDLAHGQEQDLPGFLASHPATLHRSTTPDDPSRFAADGAAGAAPRLTTLKASSLELSRLTATLHRPLRFTTGVAARHARLASRLAGCTFAGRMSNPLGSVERFQITSVFQRDAGQYS